MKQEPRFRRVPIPNDLEAMNEFVQSFEEMPSMAEVQSLLIQKAEQARGVTIDNFQGTIVA